MSIFEHQRWEIWNATQHPYKHDVTDFFYSNNTLPGVSNVGSALDWVLAVLYPNNKAAVATKAALPSVGNTLYDYRVVTDDGDGKSASYRWEQREGDSAAKWYKIMDIDFGSGSILQQYIENTQDLFVQKYGNDDLDSTGAAVAGTYAGQIIYGGKTAGNNLTLRANSGDGTGASTGFVQVDDNFRPAVDNSFDIGTTSNAFKNIYLKSSVTSKVGTPAAAGFIRLANTENISWRNAGNSADLSLTVNASNALQFNSITLVDLSSSQTLTNKTLTTPVISSISNTGTITLPTATDTLVGRATTDTLTNKTISGSSNTISNIADGSLTTSYVKADGSRGLSSNWAAGNFSATFNSVVVGSSSNAMTGIASLTSSSTMIMNSSVTTPAGTATHTLLNTDGGASAHCTVRIGTSSGGSASPSIWLNATGLYSWALGIDLAASGAFKICNGAATAQAGTASLTIDSSSNVTALGNLAVSAAGKGLQIKEGTNAKMGTATMNGTTGVTVSTTAVTSTSRIFLSTNASGGTVGHPYVDTRSAGTSFTVKSTNAADTSTIAWFIVEPN